MLTDLDHGSAIDMAPDYLYIDALLLAYHLGKVRYEEQRVSLMNAMRTATDAITFLATLEGMGVGKRSKLNVFLCAYMASPAYYRAKYPLMLGLQRDGGVPEPFLRNQHVLFLCEPVLTATQRKLFYDTYWWFVHNHQPSFYNPKKGHCIGVYAIDPQDNDSTLARFEDYLYRLCNHKTQRVRDLFANFPTALVLAILKRAFLDSDVTHGNQHC